MVKKAVLAAIVMAVVAACGSSTDDDSAAEPTPDQTSAETAVEGTLCSEAGVASDEPPPEDSEGFERTTLYRVEQPVDDTLIVDAGVACAITSAVSGDVIVTIEGSPSVAIVAPGGVVAGDMRASGTGRAVGLEDREGTSDELGPPTLEGDLLCDACSGVFATAGTIQGSVDITSTPGGGQTEFNGATIGGDVSIVDSSGGAKLDDEFTGPLLANSDVAGSVTLNGSSSFDLSPVLDGTTIGGDLSCEGNSPEPIGTDVTVEGTASGQCEGFGG